MTLAPLQPAAAHLLCIACLVVDGAARAWRLRMLIRALGGAVTFLDALTADFVEDAAAALTPLRLGGLPARAVMLRRTGLGMGTIVVASAAESAMMVPVVIVAAAALGLAFAPDWWRVVAPRIARSGVNVGGWLALALILGLAAWLLMRRFLPHVHSSARLKLALAWRELRRAGTAPLAWSLALTVISTAARLAILPILTRSVASPPALGVVALSSFVLLHGQSLLPVPSGVGAVEIGFLAGGTGLTGTGTTRLLLAWRVYTSFIVIAAGLLVAFASAARTLVGARPPRSTGNDCS